MNTLVTQVVLKPNVVEKTMMPLCIVQQEPFRGTQRVGGDSRKVETPWMCEAMGCVERKLRALLELRHGSSIRLQRSKKRGVPDRIRVDDTSVTDRVYKPQSSVGHMRLRCARDKSLLSLLAFGVRAGKVPMAKLTATDKAPGCNVDCESVITIACE